ncbi:hypothetical protein V172_22030 [Citrobacter freundii RLS1]|nr:hypothetical protein V172_22030 [Citrobacter freundii RLS1]KEL82227.1 hypothetical protein AB07_0692 [Citrobacter freundii]KWZ89387.1 hypothetical protein HMPREF3212_03257 [Citrobacter freundii]
MYFSLIIKIPFHFIKKMQQYSLLANFNLCFQRIMSAQDEQNG